MLFLNLEYTTGDASGQNMVTIASEAVWAHAENHPKYGITIHFVDEKIDSGPIVAQEKYDVDPKLSYAQILVCTNTR